MEASKKASRGKKPNQTNNSPQTKNLVCQHDFSDKLQLPLKILGLIITALFHPMGRSTRRNTAVFH